MKKILLMIMMCFTTGVVVAQLQKRPIQVENSPSIFNDVYTPYQDYADQGRRMYYNNSQFYNKDNYFEHAMPTSNGYYVQPGNSNPINRTLNTGAPLPSGTIYIGDRPVRTYGVPVYQ